MGRNWWKEAVFYQVYPRSFKDSRGDGVGDIPGIIQKIDYIEKLGVDAVWLNPVYNSPQADNGYDVRNYRKIDPEFGDMEDWAELRDELHSRGIKLVMDLVANHTSDEHRWFQKSRNRDGKYTDYYFWREGRNTKNTDYESSRGPEDEVPPNNWESFFGGPAWSYDQERGEWYLHLFDPKQPDLNWRNPDVREEIKGVMRFWLEKDVDGFRMDAINVISKPEGLPDGDAEEEQTGLKHYMNGPEVHEYLHELSKVSKRYGAVTVGEMSTLNVEQARKYTRPDRDELDMVFHFEHMDIDHTEPWWKLKEWELSDLKKVLGRWQNGLEKGWEGLYWGNHDQPRPVSRFGSEDYRAESAKLLATIQMTLKGTPFVYQGEEIGMTNFPFERQDQLRDVEMLRKIEVSGKSFEEVAEAVNYRTRDNARTPMQWNREENAGFTPGTPWIEVNPNHAEINAESQLNDPGSVFNHYRELIQIRKNNPVLIYGSYNEISTENPVYVYRRRLEDAEAVTVLNFSSSETRQPVDVEGFELLTNNYSDENSKLRPYEARIYLKD